MVEIIDGGITTPQGFKAAGVHSGVKYRSLDLGLLYSEVPAKAYCAFTSNNVKAAPVQVMMEENSPTLSAEPRLAFIMGTEGDGLPHETIAAADYTVRIPMSHDVDSLNVAAAAAVAMWQLRANKQ